jgi:tetratricopeptide (TPR) repeat protein
LADSANISEATRAALVAAAVVSRRNLASRREIARALAESLRDPTRSFLDRLPAGALSEADRSAVDSEFSAGLSGASAQGSAVTSWLGELVGLVSEVDDPGLRSTLESALRPLAEESDAGTFAGPVPERDVGTVVQNLSEGAEQGTLIGPPVDEFATRTGEAGSAPGVSTAGPAVGPKVESRFRILRPLAKGGLGQVLVAQDLELYREVALKEILPEHSHKQDSRYRFLLEAEITGRLEHPGIVPVYGLGRYPDGRPYYAMKFITGVSFLDALKAFHADLAGNAPLGELLTRFRQLVTRFVGVCQTIHFAHTRGVLHRDLKPANIMLGEFGETLVVDWGLAKALGAAGQELSTPSGGDGTGGGSTAIQLMLSGTGSETRAGSIMGTPAYMSPEQGSGKGDQAGPASDVYSLGATLYCVITGRPAFQGGKVVDLVRRVVAGEFDPPRALKPWIPKPLDAIVLKAMANDPVNRYATAKALAEDLERFLADEPVVALPETWTMRAGRWLRRHRSLVITGAGALALVAVVSLVAAFWINSARRREAAAKERAVQLFAQARGSVDTWMSGVGEIVRFYPGVQRTRERLLKEAAQAYTGFAEQSPDDPLLRLEQARTLIRLADVQQTLADYAAAQNTLERGRRILDTLAKERNPPPDWQLEAGRTASRLAFSKAVQGSPVDGDNEFRLATEFFERYRQTNTDSEALALADATTATTWAEFLVQGERRDEAEARLERARKLFPLAERGAQADAARSGLAQAQALSGQIAEHRGQWDEALELFGGALLTLEELRKQTGDPGVLDRLAGTRVRQAAVLRALGREQDEATAYVAAIDDYTQLVAAFPDVPHLRENVALTRVDLAQLLERNAQSRSAQPQVQEALAELRRLTAAPDPLPRYFETLAAALSIGGRVDWNMGDKTRAEEAFREAAGLYKLLADEYPDVRAYRVRRGVTQSQLARLLFADKPEEAFTLWDSVDAELNPLASAEEPDAAARTILAGALVQRGFEELRLGKSGEAQPRLTRAAELLGDGSRTVEDVEVLIRLLCDGPEATRDPKRAVELSRAALERWPHSATVLQLAAKCQYLAGDWAEAERLAIEARKMRGFAHPGDLFWQALAVAKQEGRFEPARELARKGLETLAAEGPHDPDWEPLTAEVRSAIPAAVE